MVIAFCNWLKSSAVILFFMILPVAAKSGLIFYQFAPLCEVLSDSSDPNTAVFLSHLKKSVSIIAPVNFIENIAEHPTATTDYLMTIEIDNRKNLLTLNLCHLYQDSSQNTQCHHRAGLSKKYIFKNQSDLLGIANQWGDLLIEHMLGFKGSLSYPLAYVENSSEQYQIIISDMAMDLHTTLYQSTSPIISLNWSPDAYYLAFIELSNSGPILKIMNIQTQNIHSLEGFKYISSPSFSKDGHCLYYIAEQSGFNQLMQYNMENHKHEVLTLSKDWLVDVNAGWDDYHLILSIDRTGSTQIYEFNLLNKKFKRLTFTEEECIKGILSDANSSLFYSLLTKSHSLLMRRSFIDHQTHYVTIEGHAEGVTAPPNPHIICFERNSDAQGKRTIVFKSLLDGRETLFDSDKDCYNPCWCPQPGLI